MARGKRITLGPYAKTSSAETMTPFAARVLASQGSAGPKTLALTISGGNATLTFPSTA
jgi:hypothetical protein